MNYVPPRTLHLKKKLGQNFLLNQRILNRIVDISDLSEKDTVLEVGAGIGNLTILLAKKAGKIIAVEYDKRFIKQLEENTTNFPNIEVIMGDVLKVRLKRFDKIVANLPFYISSKFLIWLSHQDFQYAVLLLQKEFVSKLTAEPGTEKYGRLTVIGGGQLGINIIENISGDLFYPKPKVQILLVRINRISQPDNLFGIYLKDMVTRFFTFRRKKLRKVLRFLFKNDPHLESFFDYSLLENRIFEISKEDFYKICRILYRRYHSDSRYAKETGIGYE